MKRNLLSFFLTLVLLTGAIFSVSATGDNSCGPNLTWEIDGTGKLIISGTGTMYDYPDYSAPWSHLGSSVTCVEIQSGVTSIGQEAFVSCYDLLFLILPDTIDTIADGAFLDSCIGYVCFTGDESAWQTITIGQDNDVLIDAEIIYSFTPTTVLKSGTHGTNLTWELDGTGTLTISGTGAMKERHPSWDDVSSYIFTVEMANGITSISEHAFSHCDNLRSITIPDSVTSIGTYAFYDCQNLTSITISQYVTAIGEKAFQYCDSLASITVSGDNLQYCSVDGNLLTKDQKTFLHYSAAKPNTRYEIPNTVTTIFDYSFSGCENLTDIIIPSGVTSIGENAFEHCKSLKNISLPSGVTSIGDATFSGCESLDSFTIGSTITSIGDHAFSGCDNLKSITIPDTVTSIGTYAFYDCQSLESVSIGKGVITIGEDVFQYCESLASITVSDNNAHYCSVDGNLLTKDKKTFLHYSAAKASTRYEIPNTVTTIWGAAFLDCETLTEIIIPNSVLSIGENAFHSCRNLTSITIGDNVTSIGDDAFSSTGFWREDSNWVDGVLYIGKYLIGAEVSGAYEIKPGTIGIASRAFGRNCDMLTAVTIPDGVTFIGDEAFEFCENLTHMIIPGSVVSIGDSAFHGCQNLTYVVLSDGVTSIKDYAFRSCENLEYIVIPDTVTSIGDSAFICCDSLADIYYKGSKPRWISIGYENMDYDLSNTTIHYRYGDSLVIDCDIEESSIILESRAAVSGAALYTAIYDSHGILVGISASTIDIAEGRQSLSLPFTDLSNADVLKILVWENPTSMKTLCFDYVENL